MAYYNLTFKPDCGLPQNSYRSATKREYNIFFPYALYLEKSI